MHLEPGKSYRAKTAQGEHISFLVTHAGDGIWLTADLDTADGPEPGVWLNTRLLLWISAELERTVAMSKAADEVIEALEKSEQ